VTSNAGRVRPGDTAKDPTSGRASRARARARRNQTEEREISVSRAPDGGTRVRSRAVKQRSRVNYARARARGRDYFGDARPPWRLQSPVLVHDTSGIPMGN